ncbi:serine O-acetyltransferase EpsC [Reyranella sp. CPCC 100927]|uniref:serine O-acetyltransferase EpsC n=1 Tax=Reyranella sp. CPCC 100927 TaxID=2599616 RepID=UPI0011B7E6C0|nr:serine O-acetyltransferase EpsC [Reyranella sp. CPCC 100927]TWT15000.1 serine acetyltransferase [Reyranella sp. CPCC 100927]
MSEYRSRPWPASGDDEANWDLASIVAALRVSREVINKVRHRGYVRELPSRAVLADIIGELSAALFPTHYGRPDLSDESIDYFVGNTLNSALTALAEQVRRGLLLDAEPHEESILAVRAAAITRSFAARLPAIRAALVSDLMAAWHGDPSATSTTEVLLCYPGMNAIIHHRLAHALHRLGAPVVARLIAGLAHSATGIDIHPGAEISGSFFIDHGTGVVIGETAILGENVRLYQAVTLGARRFPADANGVLIKGGARHPIIEDNVVIYAGATILGRITVGRDSVIGGNVWLTHSVPPGSGITQAQPSQDRGDNLAPSV